MNENKIPWKKCFDVCTDGAKSMTGSIKGVVSHIKKENSECFNSHCALHRHQLATKGMPPELSNVFDDVIKVVNFVKTTESQDFFCYLQRNGKYSLQFIVAHSCTLVEQR